MNGKYIWVFSMIALSIFNVAKAQDQTNADNYVVKVEAPYSPYTLRDAGGKVIGIEYDLLTAIGQKKGFKVTFKTQPWNEAIFDTLNTHESDFIGSGVIATEKRQEKSDFTDPIAVTNMVAVVLDNSDMKNFEDIKKYKVAVQKNAMAGTILTAYLENDTSNFVPYETSYRAFVGLVTNKAEVAFGEEGVMRHLVQNYLAHNKTELKFRIIPYPSTEKKYIVFAIKKGRKDLKNKFDQGLKEIKADGTYQKIMEKWMGKDNPNVVLY